MPCACMFAHTHRHLHTRLRLCRHVCQHMGMLWSLRSCLSSSSCLRVRLLLPGSLSVILTPPPHQLRLMAPGEDALVTVTHASHQFKLQFSCSTQKGGAVRVRARRQVDSLTVGAGLCYSSCHTEATHHWAVICTTQPPLRVPTEASVVLLFGFLASAAFYIFPSEDTQDPKCLGDALLLFMCMHIKSSSTLAIENYEVEKVS